MTEDEKRIKFPDQHYVGFQKRGNNDLLGFMTPEGKDTAAVKRKSTVDSWAKGNNRTYDHETRTYIEHEGIPTQVYDNAPLNGFVFGKAVNHSSSWNSCSDKWRVYDPRGFELEISSGNFEKIISTCTIINGVVQEDCIWARLGPNNILVPVNSDLYMAAKKNTRVSKQSASIKDAKAGDLVTLQNGVEGIYIGYFYHVLGISSSGSSRMYGLINKLEASRLKRYIFQNPKDKSFWSLSSIKVASIEPKDEIKDPVDYTNSALSKMPTGQYNTRNTIHHNTDETIVGITNDKEVAFGLFKGPQVSRDESRGHYDIAFCTIDDRLFAFRTYNLKNQHPRDVVGVLAAGYYSEVNPELQVINEPQRNGYYYQDNRPAINIPEMVDTYKLVYAAGDSTYEVKI